MIEFAAPADLATLHVRLELERPGGVRLNGAPLDPGAVVDVAGRLGRANLLEAARDAGRARLLVTPRVYIASAEVVVAGGLVRAAVVVRNTLENTVNVAVGVSAVDGVVAASAAATVPPGTSQEVVLQGPMPGGTERVKISVDKDEEAMEGSYRYEADYVAKPATKL